MIDLRKIVFAVFIVLLLPVGATKCSMLSTPRQAGLGHDEMLHIGNHLMFENYLRAGISIRHSSFESSMRKPHLTYFVSHLFTRLWPSGYSALLLSNMFFGFLWLAGIFFIGRTVFDSLTGLIAASIALTLPYTARLFDHFGNETSACALVAWILWIMLDEKRLTKAYWWAALGALFGLGLLAKPTMPLYLAGAFLVLAIRLVVYHWRTREPALLLQTTLGAILALAIAAAIWAPWFRLAETFLGLVQDASARPGKEFAYFHTVAGHTAWGELWFLEHWQGALALAAGALSLGFFWRERWARLLAGAFLPPLLVLTVITQDFARLMYPVWFVPILALVGLASRVPMPRIRIALPAALGLLMILSYLGDHPGWQYHISLRHNEQHPAYQADKAAAAIAASPELDRPGDALFINFCHFQKIPYYYFIMLALQQRPSTIFLHGWDVPAAFPGMEFHQFLSRRSANLNKALICSEKPDVDWDSLAAAYDAAWQSANSVKRPGGPRPAEPRPNWRLVQTFPYAYADQGAYYLHLLAISPVSSPSP